MRRSLPGRILALMATVATQESADGKRTPAKRTIGAIWQKAVATPRDVPAYLVETPDGWKEVSWGEAARRVEEIAFGLLSMGIRKGDAFGILSATRVEWALVDFALARIGAVTAPIYANSSPADCAYMLGLVNAVGVFVEDDALELAPRLQHVIPFGELEDLEARGRAHREQHPDALAQAEAAIDEEDLYTFIYTSGTTGPPKACMIRHRNYYVMVATIDLIDAFTMHADLMLLYLPLAHNFGRLLHLLGPYEGYTIAFLSDPLRTAEALPEVRPTVLPSVPRLYEKVHTRIRAQFDDATGLRRKLIDWALRVGYEASPYKRRGEPLPTGLALRHRLADRLVYSKVKQRLGGRLRIAISGGAPLAPEIAAFFHALDILILEGYGLSECTTGCSVNHPGQVKFGTVGPPLPNFEVEIADDGEILIRSETVFAGYYGDEEATRAVLDADGWLHSGDVGELDEDGFLRITDRKKDIIVTAGGKNVAPQNLENALKSDKLVSQALVIGDRRPYLIALIALDEEEAAKLAEPERAAAIEKLVDSVNAGLSRFEQIKRFAILPRDFSAEHGEVTPTLKLKRRVVETNFADEIEALYAAPR
jgi:long-chain acyl-CoA synthetase